MENKIAQITNPIIKPDVQALDGVTFLNRLVRGIIGLALVGGIIYFMFSFLSGAIGWITAGADQGKISGARKKITNSSLGLVVLFFTFGFINLIGCALGTNLSTFSLGTLDVSGGGSPSCGVFGLSGPNPEISPTPTITIAPTLTPPPPPANVSGVISYENPPGTLVNDYYGTIVPYVWLENETDPSIAFEGPVSVNNVDEPANVEGRYYFLVDEDDGALPLIEYTYKATACFSEGGVFYVGTLTNIDPEGTVPPSLALEAHFTVVDVGTDPSLCPFSYPGL